MSTKPKPESESKRFQDFAKKLVAVPKAEIDKRAAEYAKRKAERKANAEFPWK